MTVPIRRRELLRRVAVGAGVAALGRFGRAAERAAKTIARLKTKPNILLIVSDDQGWNDIGYHNPQIRTPNLDKLARGGIELDCHYVQPQCTPTRVALMTGRYPSRFGLHCTYASNAQAYPIGTLTMASMLKGLGYETAITGKWHMGSKFEWGPNHYGFDHSHGSLAGAVGMYDHRYRLKSPFARTWHRNHKFIEQEGHVTDLVAAEAVEWIKKKRNAPFFLYVPFQAVHTPIVEKDPRWRKMNEHIKAKDRRLFAAAVSHLDWAVGQIVKALDDTKQRKDTLIIFTSDNGGFPNHRGGAYPAPDPPLKNFSSNTPLRGTKGQVYEGGIRVPALVNWPAHMAPRKLKAVMHAVDWMPTLAKLLGYVPKADPKWDGRDVWPALTGGPAAPLPHRELYWVWGDMQTALRQGDWKILSFNGGKTWQLYNVTKDPYEKEDLAKSEPPRLERMVKAWQKQRAKDAPAKGRK